MASLLGGLHQCDRCHTRYRHKRQRDRCRCALTVNPFGGGASSRGRVQPSGSAPPDEGAADGLDGLQGRTTAGPGDASAIASEEPEGEMGEDDLAVMELSGDEEIEDLSDVEVGCSAGREGNGGAVEESDSCSEGDGLAAFLERVSRQVVEVENGDDEHGTSLRCGGDVGDCSDHDPCDLDDDNYDDFQGAFEPGVDPPDLDADLSNGASEGMSIPRLDTLHRLAPAFAQSKTVEGGAENLRHNTKASGSPYYPFCTKEQLLIYVWQHTHQVSQKALAGLLEILLMEDDDEGFDVRGLVGVDAAHFSGRMRPYLPLLLVLERDVPSTQEGNTTSKVFDIPLNLLLDRDMRLPSETALSEMYPGGKMLRGEEALGNKLASEHVNCVPTRTANDERGSNHSGTLARSTPFFGIDGITAQEGGRKVYVHDVCMSARDGFNLPCRILELFYDVARWRVVATVRVFRTSEEVRGVGEEETREGLVRTWEDCTIGEETVLEASDILGLAEIYTADDDVAASRHCGDWDQGERSTSWGAFVGEGFVTKSGQKRRQGDGVVWKPFRVAAEPWSREGTAENPLFGLRREGFHTNDSNLPFFSAPVTYYNDAFNAFGLGNKHSIGGSYFGWPWRTQAVQRLKRQAHVATLASAGACSQGEIGLQCEILGLLQKGCLGQCRLAEDGGAALAQEVFVRGGLLLLCGDGQGRAKCLGSKAPNHFSWFPCPYCMVRQRQDETGGDLGNARFDIDANQRVWGDIVAGFEELESLGDYPGEQESRSKVLGLAPTDSTGLPLPLYASMLIVPTRHVVVERLHFDALGQCQLCQLFSLELLSTRGRWLIQAIFAQPSGLLYPPGTEQLKDIVTNYPSLTGSDKWTLQSMMLLIFRPVLANVKAMKKNMKRAEIKELKAIWGSDEKVLEVLQKLIQVSSHLSFAVRAPSHNDEELKNLDLLARDVVGFYSEVMGRTGARPTIHSILHTVEAVRLHGLVPDASTGEFAHQQNKSGNKSDCGRDPPLHMVKRANTNAAMLAVSNGLEYKVRRYNRSTKQHEEVVVTPGAGCVRLMQQLGHTLGHDRLPTDIRSAGVLTPGQLRGQFPGSALWEANLFEDGGLHEPGGAWTGRVSSGKFRPDREALRCGYKTYFGCGGLGLCEDDRCPDCWDGDTLDTSSIDCSRYMRVPRIASCGTGGLKGGDVKTATRADPRDEWALGKGGGDNVEIHTDPAGLFESGLVEPENLTLVKILYFFRHEGNRRALSGQAPPLTWWVLGYDYVGIGHGNDRVQDSVTGHPVLSLRGRGRPKVFPVDSIRRQVHLYHQCPLGAVDGAQASFFCGPVQGAEDSGKSRVWRHKFRLASPGSGIGCDRYLLNEVHHSVNQDTIIWKGHHRAFAVKQCQLN